MNYLKRRNLGSIGLGAAFIAACSATGNSNPNLNLGDSGSSGTHNIGVGGSSGSSGNASGGSGNMIGVGNTSGSIGVPVGDGVVPNDDPKNPAITHPTCAVGECLDFPEAPIPGDGVP